MSLPCFSPSVSTTPQTAFLHAKENMAAGSHKTTWLWLLTLKKRANYIKFQWELRLAQLEPCTYPWIHICARGTSSLIIYHESGPNLDRRYWGWVEGEGVRWQGVKRVGGWHAERTKTFIYSTFLTSAFSTWPLTSHSLTAQINIPTVYLVF